MNPMAPPPPLSAADASLLREEHDLLHLLHHRNRNQHRVAKWYQWLSTLRRTLGKILSALEEVNAAKSTPRRNEALGRFNAELGFLREVVMERAYEAFGHVVSMRAFAPLGIVLLGVLARVHKVVKDTEKKVLLPVKTEKRVVVEEKKEDEVGVVISREEYEEEEVGVAISREEYREELGADNIGVVVKRTEYQEDTRAFDTAVVTTTSKTVLEAGRAQDSVVEQRMALETETASSPAVQPAPLNPEVRKKSKKRKSSTLDETTEKKKKKKKKKKKQDNPLDVLLSGLF